MGNTWEEHEQTAEAFIQHVPAAAKQPGSGRYALKVDGVNGHVRLRRASSGANQCHLHFGEPLVIHKPDEDEWYVVDWEWMLRFAVQRADAKQHTTHPLDCLYLPTGALAGLQPVAPGALQQACEDAIRATRARPMQDALKAIGTARDQARAAFESAAASLTNRLGVP